jgi:hypothetical protein
MTLDPDGRRDVVSFDNTAGAEKSCLASLP